MANEFLYKAVTNVGNLIYTAAREDTDGKPTTRVEFKDPQPMVLSGSILAKDNDTGEPVELTAVQDSEGNYVFRTVDAAPWAYVPEKDALRVVQEKKHNHLLWEAGAGTIPNAGHYTVEQYFDISDFQKVMVTYRLSASTNLRVTAVYSTTASAFTIEEKVDITSDMGSCRFEVKTGELRYIRLTNNGSASVNLTALEIRGLK